MAKSDIDKKVSKPKNKPAKKEYIAAKTINIGSDTKGNIRKKLVKGQPIKLTRQEAENYKLHKLIE